jgi:hypothetical protein
MAHKKITLISKKKSFFPASLRKLLATKAQRHEVKKCYAFSFVPLRLCGYIQFLKKIVISAFSKISDYLTPFIYIT